jgi:hypothetical protein
LNKQHYKKRKFKEEGKCFSLVIDGDETQNLKKLEYELTTSSKDKDHGIQIDNKHEIYLPFHETDMRDQTECKKLSESSNNFLKDLLKRIDTDYKKRLLQQFDLKEKDYKISATSLLYSVGVVSQQLPHIDLEESCFQCAVSLTPDIIPSTLLYEGRTLSTDEAALNLGLNNIESTNLSNFGSLLISRGVLEKGLKSIKPDGWKSLEMTMTRGGLIHAGPKSEKYRCVLFFTLVPTKSPVYNSDYQVRSWDVPSLVFTDMLRQNPHLKEYEEIIILNCVKYAIDYIKSPFFRSLLTLSDKNTLKEDLKQISQYFKKQVTSLI